MCELQVRLADVERHRSTRHAFPGHSGDPPAWTLEIEFAVRDNVGRDQASQRSEHRLGEGVDAVDLARNFEKLQNAAEVGFAESLHSPSIRRMTYCIDRRLRQCSLNPSDCRGNTSWRGGSMSGFTRSSTRLLVVAATILSVAALVLAETVSASSPRTGALHVTKECSGYTGLAGSFCTITSSNLGAIEVGSRILYLQPADLFTPAGSDVVLDPPGPANNAAFGNCSLNLGECTFWGGTGKFTWFHADVVVTLDSATGLWHWEGTYSFSPSD
jgi:hypothetical protein